MYQIAVQILKNITKLLNQRQSDLNDEKIEASLYLQVLLNTFTEVEG